MPDLMRETDTTQESVEQIDDKKEVVETENDDQTNVLVDDEPSNVDDSSDDDGAGDDSEYLSQFDDLPEDVKGKSVDDIVRDYIALKKSPPKTYQPEREPERREREQPRTEETKSFIPKNPVLSRIEKRLAGATPEAAQQWRGIATEIDEGIQETVGPIVTILGNMLQQLNSVVQTSRDSEWNSLDPTVRSKVNRGELDGLMGKLGLQSYQQAVVLHSIYNNPAVLQEFLNNQKNEGRREEQGKKSFKRFNAMRRGKPQGEFKPKFAYQKYLKPDGTFDTGRILRENNNDYNKVVEIKKAYAEDFEREHKKR